MKVSVVFLLSLASWAVAVPTLNLPVIGGGGLLGGLQGAVGIEGQAGGGEGLLAGLGGEAGLFAGLGGEAGLLKILGGEKKLSTSKLEGSAELIWSMVSKVLSGCGLDEEVILKLKEIVLKGVLDNKHLSGIEIKIIELVKGLLKGQASFDLFETIKKLVRKLGVEGIISGDLKVKILKLVEEKILKRIDLSGSSGEKKEWSVKIKEEIIEKIVKEVLIKKKSGEKLGKGEILKLAEKIIEKEVKEGGILKKLGIGKGGCEISESTKKEITKITEKSLREEWKRSGKESETLTSEMVSKCSEAILKKVSKEMTEKGGEKMEESEVLKIAEEIIKKEVTSGSLLKLTGCEEGDEEIDVKLKEQVTKIIEEKLEKELKEAGAWSEGKEKLSSEEIQKCSEVVWKEVWKIVIEKKKTTETIEESEIVKITEEVIKKEIKSGSITKIIGGGEESSSSVVIESSVKEKIKKLTEEKLTAELKRTGKESEKVSSEEWEKCHEEILTKVTKEITEKQKGGTKLEESEILKIAETVVTESVKEGGILVKIRGTPAAA